MTLTESLDIEGLLRTGVAILLNLEKGYLEGLHHRKKGDNWFDIPQKIDV